MSSIIRRRRGLIVAIWGSCPDEGRCDHPHPLRQDASAQHPRRPSRAAGSFNHQAALVFQTRGRLCATLFALGLIAVLCSFQSPYLVAFPVGVALANSLPERRGNASGYLGALM